MYIKQKQKIIQSKLTVYCMQKTKAKKNLEQITKISYQFNKTVLKIHILYRPDTRKVNFQKMSKPFK